VATFKRIVAISQSADESKNLKSF